jgi:putative ribosome biogenesis GTPase RsgA
MYERDVSTEFLSSISTKGRSEKIRALYSRVTGLDEKDFADIPEQVLVNFLSGPDYEPLLKRVLALSEHSTV